MVANGMARLILAAALVVAVAIAGCAGSLASRVDTPNGAIYVGMDSRTLTAVMGTPERVGQGKYGCHYSSEFFGFFVHSERVSEWSWTRPSGIVVAYLADGVVQQVGLVKK